MIVGLFVAVVVFDLFTPVSIWTRNEYREKFCLSFESNQMLLKFSTPKFENWLVKCKVSMFSRSNQAPQMIVYFFFLQLVAINYSVLGVHFCSKQNFSFNTASSEVFVWSPSNSFRNYLMRENYNFSKSSFKQCSRTSTID